MSSSFHSAQLQAQVRQNSQQLASYLQDLHQWEKDAKHKEQDLKAGKLTLTKPSSTSSSSTPAPPPVRSAHPPVQLRDPTAADAARFAELKAQGNGLFGKGQYSAAIECYNTCAILQPSDPLPLSNRAQCHLKMSSFALALQDCDAALAIDPAHVKTLFRRATAKKELKRVQPAIDDLQRLLQLEPANKPAQSATQLSTHAPRLAVFACLTAQIHPLFLLSLCRQLLKELQQRLAGGRQAESKEAMTEPSAAAPPARPVTELPAVSQRKKVVIEEDVDDDSEEEEPVVINKSRAPQRGEARASSSILTSKLDHLPHESNKAVAETAKPQLASQRTAEASTNTTSALPTPSPAAPPPSSSPSQLAPAASSIAAASSPSSISASSSSSTPSSVPFRPSPTPSSSSSGLRPPRSAMDFDGMYRGVRSDPVRLSKLLLLLPAADYPTILRTSLDASLFSNLVLAIERHMLPAHDAHGVWHVLSSLPTVPRFPLTVSFLGKQEKAHLTRAFQLLLAHPPPGVDEPSIRATAGRYRITEL